jgi:hypothetical protein
MYHIHFPLNPRYFGVIFALLLLGYSEIQYVAVKRKFKRPAPFAMPVSIGHVPV